MTPQTHGLVEIAPRPADADDRADRAGALQRQRARAADESDADDDELVDAHAADSVAAAGAAVNRPSAVPQCGQEAFVLGRQADRDAQPLRQAVVGHRAAR